MNIIIMMTLMISMMAMIMIVLMMIAHLMTTRPWSLVRTCFSGAKATVYLEINMITDQ